MPVQVIMPRLGGSSTEARVVEWLRSEGDWVEEYDGLLQVDTGKLGSEIPSPAAGILRQIMVRAGQTVRPGALLALIYDPEEAFVDSLDEGSSAPHPRRQPQAAPEKPAEPPAAAPQPEPPAAPPVEDLAPDLFGDFLPFEGYEPSLEAASPAAEPQPAPMPAAPTPPPPFIPPHGGKLNDEDLPDDGELEDEEAEYAPDDEADSGDEDDNDRDDEEEESELDLPPFLRSYLQSQNAVEAMRPLSAGALQPTPNAEKKVLDWNAPRIAAQPPAQEAPALASLQAAAETQPPPAAPLEEPPAPPPAEQPPEIADAMLAREPVLWSSSAPPPVDEAPAEESAPPAENWLQGGEFQDGDLLTPVSARRRSAGQLALLGHQSIPVALSVVEGDLRAMTAHLQQHRAAYARDGAALTPTVYLIAALVSALKEYPLLNASWSEAGIRIHTRIHIGLPVTLKDEGASAPVLRDGDSLSLLGIARAAGDLLQRAGAGRLAPEEESGATFTLYHRPDSAALINIPAIPPPQCALLSVGAIKPRPVVVEDAIAIRPTAFFTLAYDQRVVDDASAEAFLARLLHLLEHPPMP